MHTWVQPAGDTNASSAAAASCWRDGTICARARRADAINAIGGSLLPPPLPALLLLLLPLPPSSANARMAPPQGHWGGGCRSPWLALIVAARAAYTCASCCAPSSCSASPALSKRPHAPQRSALSVRQTLALLRLAGSLCRSTSAWTRRSRSAASTSAAPVQPHPSKTNSPPSG